MKKALLILSILALVVGCIGIPPDMIDTSAENIASRHDEYVKADTTLTDTERAAYLQETELFLNVINDAKGE